MSSIAACVDGPIGVRSALGGDFHKGEDMSNVDTAQSAYEAFGRGDLESLKESFAEDGVWVTSDELPLGGVVEGRDKILGNFAQIPNYWTSFSVDPEEFIDAGDYVLVRGTQRAGNDNGSFEAPFLHLMKFADGKVVRGEFFTDSAKAAKLLA
jgi:ketosteroid isomerase-like protein